MINPRHICFAALLTLGSANAAEETRPTPRAPEQYGRYVITFSPFARADTFLLDTETGKVWQLTKFTDLEGEPLVFKYLERVDSEAKLTEWALTQRLKIEQKK